MAADADTLMRQASDTADTYLRAVIKSIDAQFGQGFAQSNPALVASMLQACTADFAACMLSNSLDRVADALHSGLSNMG
jgi:hypothetical protein